MDIRRIDSNFFNEWQAERHYLKRKIIRSKLLAHGIFVNDELVGGLLWATPHFTKKRDLFGYPDTPDKWQVLMLGRFYLEEESGIVASQAMAESIGKGGRRGSHRRGWRLQQDWLLENPPRYPNNPFVPRLLISWSDTQWGHEGTIYKAAGWTLWDTTTATHRRSPEIANNRNTRDGHKRCWILHLDDNPRERARYRTSVGHQVALL